ADLGVHDAVADYLAREVLAGMAANVRQDLCDTSIMEQLDPSLFQALTGQSYGARLLADLDRGGGFVHRASGTGGWYRVHPLLGRLLYAELRRMDPDLAGEGAGETPAHPDGPVREPRPPSPLVVGLQVAEARLTWDLPRVLDLAAHLLQPATGNGVADRSEQAYALGLIATGAAKLHLG